MIAGRNLDNDRIDDVTLLDLRNPDASCPLTSYPIVADGPTATIMGEDMVKSCGGEGSSGGDLASCFDFDGARWVEADSLSDTRYWPSSSTVGGDTWLVTAGNPINVDGITIDTSDAWSNGSFGAGPNIPGAMERPCQVTLDDDTVFLLNTVNRAAFLLDWPSGRWTTTAPAEVSRTFAGCGMVMDAQGNREIVVAGDRTSEIYSIESQTWRPGNCL